MKCSGESSQALRVATAPAGSSLLDLPLFWGLASSSSSEAATLGGCDWASWTSVMLFFLVIRLLRRDGDGVAGTALELLGAEGSLLEPFELLEW